MLLYLKIKESKMIAKKSIFYFIAAVLIFGISSVGFCEDEEITLTTYYPAPYGTYDTIVLAPGGQPVNAQEGQIYYNDATKALYLKTDNGVGTGWVKFASEINVWKNNGDDLYVGDDVAGSKDVGIGRSTPQAKLDIAGDLALGTGACFIHFGIPDRVGTRRMRIDDAGRLKIEERVDNGDGTSSYVEVVSVPVADLGAGGP